MDKNIDLKNTISEFKIVDNLFERLNKLVYDIHKKICLRTRKIFFQDILYFLCAKNIDGGGSSVVLKKLKNKLQDKNDEERIPFDFDESAVRRYIEKIEVMDIENINKVLAELLHENEVMYQHKYAELEKKKDIALAKKKYKKLHYNIKR